MDTNESLNEDFTYEGPQEKFNSVQDSPLNGLTDRSTLVRQHNAAHASIEQFSQDPQLQLREASELTSITADSFNLKHMDDF